MGEPSNSAGTLSGFLLLIGIGCLIFGIFSVSHNLNPDYTFDLLSGDAVMDEPLLMEMPSGQTVTVDAYLKPFGDRYATEGIRLRIDDDALGFHVDEPLFEPHSDIFAMQISARAAIHSARCSFAIPDDPSFVGQTLTGRITGDLSYPHPIGDDQYEVASASVNIPIELTVLPKGERGNGDQHPIISLPFAIALIPSGLLVLAVRAGLRKRHPNQP